MNPKNKTNQAKACVAGIDAPSIQLHHPCALEVGCIEPKHACRAVATWPARLEACANPPLSVIQFFSFCCSLLHRESVLDKQASLVSQQGFWAGQSAFRARW
jgi:hypothetical protein